jgi:hypothetical protein
MDYAVKMFEPEIDLTLWEDLVFPLYLVGVQLLLPQSANGMNKVVLYEEEFGSNFKLD